MSQAYDGKSLRMSLNYALSPEETEALEKMVIETILPALRGRQLIPVTKVDAGCQVYRYDKWTHMSGAEIVGRGEPFPLDKVGRTRTSVEIQKIGKGFEIIREDLLSSDTEKTLNAKSAARQVAEEENNVIFNGQTLPHIHGLIDDAGNTKAASNAWSTAAGTRDPYGDLNTLIALCEADGFMGPFKLALEPVNLGEARQMDAYGNVYLDSMKELVSEIIPDATLPHGTGVLVQEGEDVASLVVAEDITVEVHEMDKNQVIQVNIFERVVPVVRQTNGVGTLTSI